MTKGEFQQYYAELYGQTNYTEMIDLFAENAYDYASLGEDLETGSYSIEGNQILCTATGQFKEETMRYKIEGDTLTLTYVDGVEVYTRSR